MLSSFVESINLEGIRVYPPTRYVLLCGGEVASIGQPVRSIRDSFLRGEYWTVLPDAEILQIEEIQEFFEKDSPYNDLVAFERDIAQIAELTLLFSEGPGSFAELGAFSMVDEIKENLLVVIQRKHLDKNSFITKGPVATLKSKYKNSVYSIVDSSIGINGSGIEGVDSAKLLKSLKSPIIKRLEETKSRTTFEKTKFNHICKIYVGLLKEFYVLKDEEIIELLENIGVSADVDLLNRVAFCCSAINWTGTTQAGFDRVHFAMVEKEAASFPFSKPFSDKIRRRTDIRAHWESADPDRVAAADERLAAK